MATLRRGTEPTQVCRAVLEEGSTTVEDAPPPAAASRGVEQGAPVLRRPLLCLRPACLQMSEPATVCADDWQWGEFKIRYQRCGSQGPPLILVHGALRDGQLPVTPAGQPATAAHACVQALAANCDHWRKNTPVLGEHCRVFAIDLLGYGLAEAPALMLSPGCCAS